MLCFVLDLVSLFQSIVHLSSTLFIHGYIHWFKCIFIIHINCMSWEAQWPIAKVSFALDSGSSGVGSSPGQGHSFGFLGKELYKFFSQFLFPPRNACKNLLGTSKC